MLSVRTFPSREDLSFVADNLRECDRDETFASSGDSPHQVIMESWSQSIFAYCFYWNGTPVAVCGVSALTDSIGAPWLLCTDDVRLVTKSIFWKACKTLISQFQGRFHMLTNYIDVRNTISRGWLKHLGFEEKETINYGYSQLPFIRFEKTYV